MNPEEEAYFLEQERRRQENERIDRLLEIDMFWEDQHLEEQYDSLCEVPEHDWAKEGF